MMTPKVVRVVFLTVLLTALGTTQALAQGLPIYNNIPAQLPGGLDAYGFEQTGTSEFGDRVAFAPGTGRAAKTVTITMSSWGCQVGFYFFGCVTSPAATFSHPITLNIYGVGPGNAPGSLLGTITQTFAIPFRPSADLINCTDGKWFDAGSHTCFNTKAANITFNVASLNLTLPNQVIFGIAYNTSHSGYAPLGQSTACYASPYLCGYDLLKVAVSDPATSLSVGSNPSPNDAYQDTLFGSCAQFHPPLIPFSLDAGCWTGRKPAIAFNAANPPLTKDDCKKDGWQTRTNSAGQPFPNQGQCTQYANTGK